MSRYALTQEILKEVLDYDPLTGKFIWKVQAGRASPGYEAGYYNPKGYLVIRIAKHGYEGQLLAYIYMTGSWPKSGYEVDHIDRNPSNNAWLNLRLASKSENQYNAKIPNGGSTGIKGLTYCKVHNRWIARISVSGNRLNKTFPFHRKDQAIQWLENKRIELHGDFANRG